MIKDSYDDMVRTDNRIALFLGTLFAVFMLSMAFVSATSITDGLEAYYKLDETTGLTATDFSGNGNDGTMEGYTFNHGVINGGVTIEDGAMAFNGTTGYVEVPHSADLNVDGNLTIALWVNQDTYTDNDTILQKGNGETSGGWYLRQKISGNLQFTTYSSSGIKQKAITVELNEWKYIVVVVGNGYITSYVNGVSVGTPVAIINPDTDSTSNLFIGKWSGSGRNFDGSLDDVQIYNRALTSDEISAQYNAGRGSYALSGDGLVAQYSGRDYNATHILDTNPVVEGATDNTAQGKRFGGTKDYIKIFDNTSEIIDLNNPVTISGWVKKDSDSLYKYIVSLGYSRDNIGGIALLTDRILINDSINEYILYLFSEPSSSSIWNHYTATIDSNIKVWINGNLVLNTPKLNTGTINTSKQSNIGARHRNGGSFQYPIKGSIDEVGVWSRALTEEEILYLYESSPHAQTTFTSEQVSGTTDQNITLTCTAINGCKAINYNINNEGWAYELKTINEERIDNTTYATISTEYVTVSSYDVNGIDNSFIKYANIWIRSLNNWSKTNAKLKYTYSDSSTNESDVVTMSSSTFNKKSFSTLSDEEKVLSKIDLLIRTSDSETYGVQVKDLNLGLEYSNYANPCSFIYSGSGDHNIQYFSTDNADNNEATKLSYFPMFKSENESSNSRIKLTGVTWYNGYEITSWQYQVNGTPLSGTSDRIKYYSTQSNEDLNVCLTTNSTDTICKSVLTWDTINPTIDANIQTSGYGFTNTFDINYNLTCNDNFPFITYKVILINNGTTTILDEQYLTTGTLLQGTLDLNAGQEATLTFTCTDASNNQATYTAPTQYAIQFNIVDETTGLPFDLTKVTHAQAYTYDGNYLFNFKDTNNATQTYWSPTSVIRFDFTYPDEAQTKISREIDFDHITDANVPVCAAEYQQFYLYRFLSTTEKPIILHNDFANCYSLASTTKFLWTTYLTNTAYTINKPYYLYTYSNGVKSLLAILDGANNTEINLDILQFNQAQYQFDVSSDSIVFRPGENDSNTIVFYFFSPNNNTWVNLEIYDQSNNLLWDYLENTDTNSFQVTFFYGDLDINSDDLLKIVITVLNDGEETSFFKYFNTKGEAYAGLLNPIVAIVLSFFVLFFGITMVSYRFAMGWFGIVISFLAIGILALAPLYDYILFLMAIYFIIGLFIGLIGREQTLGVN